MLDSPLRDPFIGRTMTHPRLRPAWALLLAGVFAVFVGPDAARAQRRAPRVSSVEITPADAATAVGQTVVFTPIAYDAANNPLATAAFACTSSNERVATVDANCIATGVAVGTAIITARTGTGAAAKRATATLTVAAANLVQTQGQQPAQPQPTPTGAPAPGRPAGAGYAAFECQPDGTGAAAGLTLSPLRLMLARGESKQLTCRAVRSDGETAARVPIVFSVLPGGERVVAVDSVGFIRATGDTGRATVQAEVPNSAVILPRQVAVEVRADTVRFAEAEMWLSPGTVDTLVIEVPAQDRPFNVRGEFQFTSTDETKVRVSPLAPVITAVAPGSARIVGESPFFTLITTVNVHRRAARFSAAPADSALTVAMTTRLPFQISVLGEDSTPVPEAPLRWTLPDTTIARFDTATRTLQAIRSGETRLGVAAPYSRDSLVRRTWQIRVVAGGLAASRTRLGLGVGERSPVAVELLDDRRQPIGPATALTWASARDSVARYEDGNVVGVGPGRARLTARTPWDSTVSLDVFVGDRLLASALRGGRWDLYYASADSVPRFSPITADSVVEREAVWAPDLTRIAWVAPPPDRPAGQDLYVANADGSEPRRLTFDSATVSGPVFVRPEGGQIVFESNRATQPGQRGVVQLYIVNVDGTGRRQITTGDVPNQNPDVSPDGTRILFVSLRRVEGSPRSYDIWLTDLDGAVRRMTASPRNEDSPQFAADGQSFYFLRDEGGSPPTKRVYRQSVADTAAVAEPLTPVGMFVSAFSVSPDGSLLVLTVRERARGGDQPRIVLFTPAGGTVVNMQVGAGEQLSSPVFRPATPRPR